MIPRDLTNESKTSWNWCLPNKQRHPPNELNHISSGFLNHLPELPTLIHFNHYITPPNKLPANIQLRNSRPLTKNLDPLSNFFICQHIDRFKLDIVRLEDLTRSVAEATLGE